MAQALVAQQGLSHVEDDGETMLTHLDWTGLAYVYAGKVLSYTADPREAEAALAPRLASPPHREILLGARYSLGAVGHADGTDGGHYFAIILLSRPRDRHEPLILV